MAAELCTRLHVLTAVPKLKCRSSQLKAVQSTVEPATRNTDGTRLTSGLIRSNLFVFSFLPYFLANPCPSSEAGSNHRDLDLPSWCWYSWSMTR